MNNKLAFLKQFKLLEKHLRVEYERGDYKESSFMATLFRIRGRKENPIIANPAYFDVLQQAAQLRNIIVHNDDIADPTDEFLAKFKGVVKLITTPERVDKVMIPLFSIKKCTSENTIDEVMNLMEQSGYSKIPVIQNNRLIGVFTEKAFYYYLALLPDQAVSRRMKVKELLEAIDLDGDPAPYFDFIARAADVFQALRRFRRDFKEKNKLEMLFVTENGQKHELVLGILTLKDLEHVISI